MVTIQEQLDENETSVVVPNTKVSYLGVVEELATGTLIKLTIGSATKQFRVPTGKKLMDFSVNFSGELVDE